MAKFINGPLTSAISGRVGTIIFTSYKGVGVIRQMPTSVRSVNSPAQQDARTAASYIAQQWNDLPPEDQDPWEDDREDGRSAEKERRALGCKSSIYKGHPGPMSGFNVFLMRNMNRYEAGITPYTNILKRPALGVSRPEGFASVSAIAGPNYITFSWTPITNVPRPDRLKLWIRSIDAKVHVQLAGTAPIVPAGSIIITQVRMISGLPISLPPGKYQLQAVVIDYYGKESVASEVITVRVGEENFNLGNYSPRQLLFQALNQGADIPWTAINLAPIVMPQTNGLLIYAELELGAPGGGIDYAILKIRKDATQGMALEVNNRQVALSGLKYTDSGIVPVTLSKDIEYALSGAYAGGARYNIRIYAIAQIY